MALDEQDLKTISELIKKQMSPAAPVVEESSTGGLSKDDLMAAFSAELDKRGENENNKIFSHLFDEKLKQAKIDNQGLSDYLDSKDDYGKVRIDQISSGTYEEKVSALAGVTTAFNEALEGTAGRAPIPIPKHVKEAVDKNREERKGIDDKLQKGEYSTVSSVARDFMNSLSSELGSLKA